MRWPDKIEKQGEALHRSAIVIDALNSSARAIPTSGPQIAREYFEKPKAGGVTSIAFTIAINDDFRGAVDKLNKWDKYFESWNDILIYATCTADIERAKAEGKIAVLLQFQNTQPIERDMNLLRTFYRLGVRTIQLTYNERNYVGDGCTERTNSGLSDFGVDIVREMNRLGMLIDLSHVGEQTSWDAMEISSAPVVFSHANVRALCNVERNLSDETIRRLARNGGVIGINTFGPHITEEFPPTLDHLVDHVDYIKKLVGIDHVGMGLDLTEGIPDSDHTSESGQPGFGTWRFGISRFKEPSYPRDPARAAYPEGIRSISEFPNVTKCLLGRGYTEEDVRRVIGGNFLRVYREVIG